ncbi:MAG: NifU family protein [Actinobacteria bacterium]|nr:NifU family protein [Actinomycetota bacterium]
MTEAQVRTAVDAIAMSVRADGGDLQLLGYDDERKVARVGYDLDSSCDVCVLTPDQLGQLLGTALERQAPEVTLELSQLET